MIMVKPIIRQYKVKSDGKFGILEEPKRESGYRKGLYIKVVNFESGEHCYKKVYKNTKGRHFKHSGGKKCRNILSR